MSKNRPTLTLNRPAAPQIVTPEATSVPIQQPAVAKGDIVDRIFDLLPGFLPEGVSLEEAKAAVREEWGGQQAYVQKSASIERAEARAEVVRQVNAQFNGRNARELARKLNISVVTVYRMITRR